MTRNGIVTRLIATLSALGLMVGSASVAQSAGAFRSVQEAREYLSQNPTGPLAAEAFRLIVASTLSDRYPEFSSQALADGNATVATPTSGATTAAILQAFADLAGSGGGSGGTAVTPARERRVY